MTSGGRRRVLLEKRAVIGLSYLILLWHVRRDGIRAAEGRDRAREPRAAREGVRELTEPRVHGRWIVQLMRMSLETCAEYDTFLCRTISVRRNELRDRRESSGRAVFPVGAAGWTPVGAAGA